jgi:hypothetical protein
MYGLGLILITLGLVDVSIASPGSVLSWTGRLSQSLGHIYLLAAFVTAIRAAAQKGFDIRAAAAEYYLESEANYRALVDTLRAAVISVDPSAEWCCGTRRPKRFSAIIMARLLASR